MNSMNGFWIIGIIINVVMAVLVTWWVLRSMRSSRKDDTDRRD